MGTLHDLVDTAGSKAAAARELGVAPSTFKDRLNREASETGGVIHYPDFQDGFVEIPVFHRDYSHLDSLRLYPIGDAHKGTPAHDAQRWREWLKYLVDNPRCSMIGTGDLLNAALKDSKSDSYHEIMTVGQAKRELRGELTPLASAGRLDILLSGNHEERIHRAIGDCPIEDLADSLGCNYAPASAVVVYHVGDVEYLVYIRHGTGNVQSLLQLEKGAGVVHADVFITGHTHKQAATADEFFVYDREADRMVRHQRFYVSSGSFLRQERYASVRGYRPTRIGAPRVYLDGRVRDIHVSV